MNKEIISCCCQPKIMSSTLPLFSNKHHVHVKNRTKKRHISSCNSSRRSTFFYASICFLASLFCDHNHSSSSAFTTSSMIRSHQLKYHHHRRHYYYYYDTKITSTTTQLYLRKQKPLPIIGYNGEDICDYYDRRPLIVGWRLNILSLPLLGQFFYRTLFFFISCLFYS